jgi:large subunit ribosomal protein L6
MSRIGKHPIVIPAGVTVEVKDGITVKEKWSAYTGVFGRNRNIEEGQVQVDRSSGSQKTKEQNMVYTDFNQSTWLLV